MPFPAAGRIIYERNPLREVVCQLRFPPILRIDAEPPAAFQEAIRRGFPGFSEAAEWKVEVPQALRGAIPPEVIRQMVEATGVKNYEFSSEDGRWRVNLTRTFVALTTTRYHRWEEFKARLEPVLNALERTYSPAHYSRIGLRYVDVIRRSELGLDGVPWSELIQPYLLGVLGAPGVGEHVQQMENAYEIALSDSVSVVRLVTKLDTDGGERCYVLDSDFFDASRTRVEDALSRLEFLNQRGSRLIQWAITPRLHLAMEPKVL